MTIISQSGVQSNRHGKNLRNYIDDKETLLRAFHNIRNESNWYRQMERTRIFYGHDKAGKAGAKNTLMLHRIMAFNADHCDFYGGKMTPALCMQTAEDYAREHYPHHEIVLALHKEHCTADGTDRYAVHMAINRTNLETGKRLNEGIGFKLKKFLAGHGRRIDEVLGLEQVIEGKPNSVIHPRQPAKDEKEMIGRGVKPYKTNLRELIAMVRDRSYDFYSFQNMLKDSGVEVEKRNGRIYVKDEDHPKHSFNLTKLDGGYTNKNLNAAFRQNQDRVISLAGGGEDWAMEIIAGERSSYEASIKGAFESYTRLALSAKGTTYDDFPGFVPLRRPNILSKDFQSQSLFLEYHARAERLKDELASDVPYARKRSPLTSGSGVSGSTSAQTVHEREREETER